MNTPTVEIGLERCCAEPPALLTGARFGLLMNQASVDRQFRYACDVLADRFPGQLAALFSPQHGLWGTEQANMIETPHGCYAPLDLPVYSLYSETRRPTREMLRGIDCLLVDLQDVGTRVYTFAWTLLECLRACAEAGVPVLVLDRPNPLGGQTAEGPLVEPSALSFVGGHPIPLRHGLTLGELARLLNAELRIGCQLEVVPMRGWRRSMLWRATGRTWVAPSPNMPRWETALFYPGQVMLEGTNLSEGRGTTLPFEVVGAPFIDPHALQRAVASFELSGISLRPIRFVPTFDKWRGQECGGIALHAVEPAAVHSVALMIAVLAAVQELYPSYFAWLPPPYEYEREKPPIDILFGSSRLRERLAFGMRDAATIGQLAALDDAAWKQRAGPYLLYE